MRAPAYPIANKPRIVPSAGGRRAPHSPTPNAANAAAVNQYWSGGFSKYLRPSSRGVTQSPVTTISRAISA